MWWSLSLSATSTSWRLYRDVGKAGTHGEMGVIDFEEIACERFSDLAERVPSLLDELVDSARTFNVGP